MHVFPLNSLKLGPVLSSKESEVTLYAWALDTSSGQAPLIIQVDKRWILPSEDHVTVNKVAAVDFTLQNMELSNPQVALDESAPKEKVWAAVAVCIPQCLTPALLIGVRSPHDAWGILRDKGQEVVNLRSLITTVFLAEGSVNHGLRG